MAGPPAARGALALEHGDPLGSRAELRPRGPCGASLEPLRGAAVDADFTASCHPGGELASSLLSMTPFVREAPSPQKQQLKAADELAVTQLV